MSGLRQRVGPEDASLFLELVRRRMWRLDLRWIQAAWGFEWAAVHRVAGRLRDLGLVKKDARNIEWLDRDAWVVVDFLADRQPRRVAKRRRSR